MAWLRPILVAAVACGLAAGMVAEEQMEQSHPVLPDPILEEIWQATFLLPEEKRARLTRPMLETVAASGDTALLGHWEGRLGTRAPDAPDTYYKSMAEPGFDLLERKGEATVLRRVRSGAPPFNIGRPQILSAMAIETSDDTLARRIMNEMDALMRASDRGGGFERDMLAHGLAEAAMRRCDLTWFDRARSMTQDPGSVRYAFWRARITGEVAGVTPRIQAEAEREDTRFVRQALEGYRAILEHGPCQQGAGMTADKQSASSR